MSLEMITNGMNSEWVQLPARVFYSMGVGSVLGGWGGVMFGAFRAHAFVNTTGRLDRDSVRVLNILGDTFLFCVGVGGIAGVICQIWRECQQRLFP